MTPETDRVCGARTRGGTPCKLAPMPNGRCYRHGGATPSGAASPHFKHGRYSKSLSARLVGRYEEAHEDRRLLELREEIALVTFCIMGLLARMGWGDSKWLVGELRKAWTELQRARRAGNAGAEEAALARLGELITSHHEDRKVWREICRMIDHKRRLVESERKRLVQARQMVPVEEVVVLVAALTDSVAQRVDDPAVRAAIGSDVERYLDAPPNAGSRGPIRRGPPG